MMQMSAASTTDFLKTLNVYQEIIQIDSKVKEFKFDIEKVQMLRRETGPETDFKTSKSA